MIMLRRQEKHRRMEIRRNIGNRQVGSNLQLSVGYFYPYLSAHACFSCQKSFKLSCDKEHICPQCGETVYLMGRAFKAPKRRDDEQWRKVQKLYALGFRFYSYEEDDPPLPPLPKRLREVDNFVLNYPHHELRIAKPNLLLLQRL